MVAKVSRSNDDKWIRGTTVGVARSSWKVLFAFDCWLCWITHLYRQQQYAAPSVAGTIYRALAHSSSYDIIFVLVFFLFLFFFLSFCCFARLSHSVYLRFLYVILLVRVERCTMWCAFVQYLADCCENIEATERNMYCDGFQAHDININVNVQSDCLRCMGFRAVLSLCNNHQQTTRTHTHTHPDEHPHNDTKSWILLRYAKRDITY